MSGVNPLTVYFSCAGTCPGSGAACGAGQNMSPMSCPVTLAGYLLSPSGL